MLLALLGDSSRLLSLLASLAGRGGITGILAIFLHLLAAPATSEVEGGCRGDVNLPVLLFL